MRYALLVCAAMVATIPAAAQFVAPAPAPVDGAILFRRQCATCHALSATEPPRQGPHLAGVVGRPVGSVAGFAYSPGYATAGFVWDADHLDSYLANPQAMIPGSIMAYRQGDPAIRQTIIAYLKGQN